jgi:hypothetical protein
VSEKYNTNVIDFQAALKKISPQVSTWMTEQQLEFRTQAMLERIRRVNEMLRQLSFLIVFEEDKTKIVTFRLMENTLQGLLRAYQDILHSCEGE